MDHPTPGLSDAIYTALMGFWAFLGGVMRAGADWTDPKTGRLSWARVSASVATAMVLGQIASAIGSHYHWEPAAIGALASFVGYLGPAATMQLFQKRFGLGGTDATPVIPPAKD